MRAIVITAACLLALSVGCSSPNSGGGATGDQPSGETSPQLGESRDLEVSLGDDLGDNAARDRGVGEEATGDTMPDERHETDAGSGAESDATGPPDEEAEPAPRRPSDVTGDPGRVTLHRINRVEYNNTVRDLFGTTQRPGDDFPSDDHGYGYDNNADVLSMSPLLFEFYAEAAESLVTEALTIPMQEPVTSRFEIEDVMAEVVDSVGAAYSDWGWNFWSNGEASMLLTVPEAGLYRFRVSAGAQQAGDEIAKLALTVDGAGLHTFDIDAMLPDFAAYDVELELEAGERFVTVGFINDFYIPAGDPCTADSDCGSGVCNPSGSCAAADRNLVIDALEVYGPLELLDATAVNPQRQAIMVCEPYGDTDVGCLREIIATFGLRAWRRPMEDSEVDALLTFIDLAVEEGDDYNVGLSLVLQAIVTSPHFIFRVEVDPDPFDDAPHPLSPYELASRLSYFLWSSMPDQALFDLAESGALTNPEVLDAQVDRMLDHPNAHALVEGFGGQWLYFKAIDDVIPDPWVFEGWSEALRSSMRTEAWLFFHSFVQGDRNMLELLDSSDVFIDERLATHYGIEGFSGPPGAFVQMQMQGAQRGGVARQGAVLTALSYPTRTSPVKRGKWILGQLMCQEPPPPPPGVEGLPEADLAEGAMSIREILAIHREDPVCASCHVRMDPIGLAFEHYDGVGRWRDDAHGIPVDPSGELPAGEVFADADELIDILVADPSIPRCMAQQLATYALGRGIEASDLVFIDDIKTRFIDDGYRFRALVKHLVTSRLFLERRGEPEAEDRGGEP